MMGPLAGLRIVEIAGIGPGPFCGMLLADLGADVVQVRRPGAADAPQPLDFTSRSKRSVEIDIKTTAGLEALLALVAHADALIDVFRPGVAERIGFGPNVCFERNPALVYGRMTGWGQEGPLAHAAGHDLNYIAVTGALHAIGRKGQPPTPPLNMLGDYGGGALYLAFGIVSALLETRSSGKGQVVDAAMVDGVVSMMTPIYARRSSGRWTEERGTNLLDSGRFYYDVYECADGRWVSVAAIEDKFYIELMRRLEIDISEFPDREDPDAAVRLRELLEARFRERSQKEWCDILEGSDSCFAPVLEIGQAADHPHLNARQTFIEIDGIKQPAPAPRFSRTPAPAPASPNDATLSVTTICNAWASQGTGNKKG